MANSIKKYNWQTEDKDSMLANLLQGLFEKHEGDQVKINDDLDRMKKDGTINQILGANKYNIKQMVDDKLQFIIQINN